MARILALLLAISFSTWLAGTALADTAMPAIPQVQGNATGDTPPPLPPPLPPPIPTQPAEVAEWYYGAGGQALGPFTVSYLRDLAAKGEIIVDTPVWKPGMAAWVRLAEVPELASVVAAISGSQNQPPPPPDSQALLNEAARRYLLGTWRYDGPITQANITAYVKIELTYRPDGSYAGTQSVQMPPMGGIQPPPQTVGRSGRYTVTGIDQDHFVLTMNEVGSPGVQVSLKIIDQNTVEDTANLLRSVRIR